MFSEKSIENERSRVCGIRREKRVKLLFVSVERSSGLIPKILARPEAMAGRLAG